MIVGLPKRKRGQSICSHEPSHAGNIENSGTHWKNELRYRTLSPPYTADDWSEPTTVDTNVFTVTLGIDASAVPRTNRRRLW